MARNSSRLLKTSSSEISFITRMQEALKKLKVAGCLVSRS